MDMDTDTNAGRKEDEGDEEEGQVEGADDTHEMR